MDFLFIFILFLSTKIVFRGLITYDNIIKKSYWSLALFKIELLLIYFLSGILSWLIFIFIVLLSFLIILISFNKLFHELKIKTAKSSSFFLFKLSSDFLIIFT